MIRFFRKIFVGATAVLFLPSLAFSSISISEIMYDFPGPEGNGEHDWIEVFNGGSTEVDLSKFKFFEANTNHGLKFDRGLGILQPGGFAVIANATSTFLADWPNFSGTLFDSSFSLNSTSAGETLIIRNADLVDEDKVTYSSDWGAKDDGNSLQKVDGVWRALLPTPGMANATTGATSQQSQQTSTSTSANASSDTSESQSSTANQGNYSSWPVEPQIISRITGPSTAISGADIILKGEALGLDKKPLQNPRFLWNFGDGATKEGESVFHSYNFPGEYVVILEVSSGKYEGSSRVNIKAFPADISIEGVVPGFDGKIELVNNSKQELDLSWWRIKSGANFFTLPKNTKILSTGRLTLSASVVGFPIDTAGLALLYPNGVESKRFEVKDIGITGSVGLPEVSAISDAPTGKILTKDAQSGLRAKIVDSGVSADNIVTSQMAAVVEASVPLSASGEKTAETGKSILSPWLYGVGGIVILALGSVFVQKRQPIPKNDVDEYKIIED